MSTTYNEAATAAPTNSTARVATASIVGTAIEFYDFYIYATAAALVIGPVFFPQTSGTAQMLASFLTFGIAFIARPLGSALFGHFGDRVGRKSTLVASLLLMGGCGVAGDRERAQGQARLVRHVPATRPFDWLPGGQRPVPDPGHEPERRAVSQLGLAHPVHPQRSTGDGRPVCAAEAA